MPIVLPLGNELNVTNHLLDTSGQQVWTRHDITIAPDAPPGPYSVPDIVNVDALDAAGQPAGNGVRLGIP